jgi:hypothetical protein
MALMSIVSFNFGLSCVNGTFRVTVELAPSHCAPDECDQALHNGILT